MKGQLLMDGELGKLGTMSFPSAVTVIDHLQKTGHDALLTIGLSFKNPRTHDKPLDNRRAIEWVNENPNYMLEACYTGDDILKITALSGSDF